MSANAQYILLLVVAVALTFLVGQLLVRAGEPFLFEVFQDRKVTRSVNLLLSVLFYLITLGVLAIISMSTSPTCRTSRCRTSSCGSGSCCWSSASRTASRCWCSSACGSAGKADEISEHVAEKLAERGVDPRPVTPQE